MKRKEKVKYKNIFENLSTFSLLRDFGNKPFSIEYDKDKEIYFIGLEEESVNVAFEGENEKGGIIVLSTDVNALRLAENDVINWVKKKFYTYKNRLQKSSMIDKAAKRNHIEAMTVGYYLRGKYKKPKTGEIFTEHSLSVEILGIDEETLFKFADELCEDFLQECVLVKSYKNNKIYFVDNN